MVKAKDTLYYYVTPWAERVFPILIHATCFRIVLVLLIFLPSQRNLGKLT